MYARDIDGRVYDFGVSGKLIMNGLVMYDRQTESYWSQILGEAVEGEMVGTKLEFIQSWFTTWQAWKTQHPDTIALRKNGRSNDPYASYYSNDDTGVQGAVDFDARLDPKSFVVGVENDGEAIAYPFRILRRDLLIHDMLSDQPIVIVYIAEGQTGLVYERTVGNRALNFRFDAETITLIDEETGTTWDAWRGLAIDGELEGQALSRVPSTRSFWFGWRDYYPQTDIFSP